MSHIASIASDMGIIVSDLNFDSVNLIKDLEIARHALYASKEKMLPHVNEVMEENPNIEMDEVPLLEWLDDNSERESFTLVQSRKRKKRKIKTPMGNPLGGDHVRRSKRTTPSLYRNVGDKKNPNSLGKKTIRRNP
jgi:hypothetical protein